MNIFKTWGFNDNDQFILGKAGFRLRSIMSRFGEMMPIPVVSRILAGI